MIYLFVTSAFVISAFLAWILIPRILLISMKKKLYDIPDARKVHTKAIPRLGGVSFFPTILFSFCFVMSLRLLFGFDVEKLRAECLVPEMLLLACGMTLLYLTGIADDLVGVRYRQKFIIQIFCASLFPLCGLWLNNLYGLFGIHEISPFFGIPFTIFTVVFITNAINLIDGIDGLASGLSSVALLIFGFLFLEKHLWAYSMLAFATFGVLVPFFYYNVFGSAEKARKIFMGDTGSLTLGYILSFLAIKYSVYNPEITPYTQGAIVIAFSTLILPAFDVIRVVLVRIREKKSPFEADRNHIHHKFLAMGYTTKQAMIYLILIALTYSVVNIILVPYVDNTLVLITDFVVWVLMNLWWDKRRDRIKNQIKNPSVQGQKD